MTDWIADCIIVNEMQVVVNFVLYACHELGNEDDVGFLLVRILLLLGLCAFLIDCCVNNFSWLLHFLKLITNLKF